MNGSSWSSPFLLHEVDAFIPDATNTFDSKTHIVYYDGDILYRNYNGSTWSTESTIGTGGLGIPKISSVSNDLYVTWTGNNYVKYLQYDAIPLTPQNLQIKKALPGPNYLIKVVWDANVEADLSLYEIWRKVLGSGCSEHDWQVIGTSSTNSYIDYDYFYGGSCYLYYKVRAKDVGNHYSNFSAEISSRGSIAPKIAEEGNENTVFNYFLSNNYPNPFNPSTTISYAIESAGRVTLKVYDMLGKEVASLVDEVKEAGNYSVNFNASDLPSGIYFYTLTSGNFTGTKKLILLK